ncbi:DNA polymerase, partial [Murine adenovirus 1]
QYGTFFQVPAFGSSGIHRKSTDTNLNPSSITGGDSSSSTTTPDADAQSSSRTPARGRPRKKATVSSPKQKQQSKVLQKAHKTLRAACPRGDHMVIGYFTSYVVPFTNLLCLQRCGPFPHPFLLDAFKAADIGHKSISVTSLTRLLQKEEWPAPVNYVWYDGLYIRQSKWPGLKGHAGRYPQVDKDASYEEKRWCWQNYRPELTFLHIQKGLGTKGSNYHKIGLYLVDTMHPCQRCEDCGSFFRFKHTCNARRRSFFFHNLKPLSRQWWTKISFTPLGSIPTTKRLFIIYDLETYCWHGSCGKQLVPFMLVMELYGDMFLCAKAHSIAKQMGYSEHHLRPYILWSINPQKEAIGRQFRRFRDRLQEAFAEELWQNNIYPELQTYIDSLPLGLLDLTPERLEQEAPPLKNTPKFIEVYVVGHNINGFDEIVVAAQVLNNRVNFPPPLRVHRHFMPRNGRILFNDITFSLPNPRYKKRTDFEQWEQGCLTTSDSKIQYVKFMVRDTFALTHTSLRKAAEAYSLPLEKGVCPYAAVNDFYMTGRYDTINIFDGFPHRKYWNSEAEYEEGLQEWKKEKEELRKRCPDRVCPIKYNLIEHTLKYCIQDVTVTTKLVCKLLDSYHHFIQNAVGLPKCLFNIFQRPTISANSHAIFKQTLYSELRPEKPNFDDVLLAPSREMYDFVRQSIRGGRCYPTVLGELKEPIYVYDICGMYASALTHPMPSGWPLEPKARAEALADWTKHLSNSAPISYFNTCLLHGIVLIDADPPCETQLDVLPPFCSRKGGRLCWTNEPLRGEITT